MVDNRGITPVSSSFNFKSGDISGTAAKTSEEKMGQGGEYFAQEVEEENVQEEQNFQDRSAQLRASLDSLALANVGSIRINKMLEERKQNIKKAKENKKHQEQYSDEEYLYDE